MLSPLLPPPSRLVFNSAHKCKIWKERLLESLRCSVRTLKSTFAFVHRAYSRDQKMEGSQQSGPNPPTALHSLKGKGNHQASSKAVTTPGIYVGGSSKTVPYVFDFHSLRDKGIQMALLTCECAAT